MTDVYIATELAAVFSGEKLFRSLCALQGETFRELESRRTLRTQIGAGTYFVKLHFGVGWREIIKNLAQGRLPVLGAANEWRALRRLTAAGVPTMTPVLYVRQGINPARQQSAIVTRALENKISLEDFCTAEPKEKRQLIRHIAGMAREMHAAGVNHRDFYLCHFLMDIGTEADPVLHLIDLHRAQVRHTVPDRWLVKDLGGLLFSAFDKQLTPRDLLRFIAEYRGQSPAEVLRNEAGFWHRVRKRAVRLYLQDHEFLPEEIVALLGLPS